MNIYEINFCDVCNNLTNLIIEDKILKHNCKCCKTKKEIPNVNGGICVHTALSDKVDKSILLLNNEYIKEDITLPVIENNENISCPNETCESHEKGSSIKYIKYDIDEIKYMYICNYCNFKWKNSK